MTSAHEGLLDAAADLLATHGFQGLRMIEVATRAGVSRQTLYNEFGNKEGLVQAVALYRTTQYLHGFESRLATQTEPFEALRSAFEFTFEQTARDRLVSAILTGQDAEDLLPLLTTRGQPVLVPATEAIARHLRRHWPDPPIRDIHFCAETITRLALSHLLLPSGDLGRSINALIRVARAILPAM